MRRRAVAVGLLLALVLLAVPAGARALPAGVRALPASRRVVVVAVPGLRWEDITAQATPALWELARRGAVGALSVKAGPAVSCRADGLLTLTAGARATAYGAPCGRLPADLPRVLERNRRSRERADPQALASALLAGGACLGVGGAAPTCPVQLVEGPTVDGSAGIGAGEADRAVAATVPTGSADLLVVGSSEAPGDRAAHLHVAIAVGPDFRRGALVSASTQRTSYVQLVDVAPTVLGLLGLPVPATMIGQPWQVRGHAAGPDRLRDLDRRAVAQKADTVPVFVAVLVLEFVLITGLLTLRRRRAARVVALAGAAFPAAAFLAGLLPWWRAGPHAVVLLVLVVVVSGGVGVVASRRPGRLAPVGAVCALTAGVLVLDLLSGCRLQLTSIAGYSPLVAGRFTGIGNVAFGVYAAAGLVALAAVARGRWWPVVLGGVLLTVVDGAPPWGSDVGGVLALVPAVAVLALQVSGRRLSLLRVTLAGLSGLLLVTALALADHARPAERRTHLGRFVDQVADGTAGAVLARKADAVFGLLFSSPVTALLPLVVLAAVLLVRRPPRPLAAAFEEEPAYRQGLLALGVACAVGFLLNDSGAAIPALALVVVLPATVAVVSGRPPGTGAG